MSASRNILIDPLSASSLLVEVAVNGQAIGTATGFIVQQSGQSCLITNWHVVAGRNPDTNQVLSNTGGLPDEIRIVHHASQQLGSWVIKSEPLFDSTGNALWMEHPQGRTIDVVALPLTAVGSDVALYPFDLSLANADVILQPAMPVSIIGYPFGLAAAGAWPIWKTGHIASDPDLDYDGRPAFLIDATTRGGMSGSPVVMRLTGGYRQSSGNQVISGMVTKFLGVYSGRIHGQAEIGKVWRPPVIQEILQRPTP